MADFFIPLAKDKEQEKRVLKSIIEFNKEQLGADIDSQRIQKLDYTHDGKNYIAEVGKPHVYNKEPVIAILHDKLRDLYLVCTTNRGVVGGIPIMVGKNEVNQKTLFN